MYVQLLLNDHDPEVDLWAMGGEPILRDGIYCGQTTTTGNDISFRSFIALRVLSAWKMRQLIHIKNVMKGYQCEELFH